MATVGFHRRDGLRLRLELSEPNKVGDSWQSTAIATATSGREGADADIQFYLNGNPVGTFVPTDADGRAVQVLSGLIVGNYLVEAMIVGSPAVKRSCSFFIKGDKRQPHALELKATGQNGMHVINATIVDENGFGVSGTIRILSGPNRQDFSTDAHGVVVIDLDVEERQEEFRFLVLGTAIDQTLRLSGPKQERLQYEAPNSFDIANPFRAFMRGWRERKEAERG